MQDGNFLLSALQPEAGVCSLALPSDLQLDRRGAEGPEAERLRAARVQEQVRARLLQLGQQPRHNGAAEPQPEAETARGTSRGQYHTLQAGFSSRSQGLSGDKTSGFRPIAKPAYSPASWSSRSAVDLSCSRRLSSAHNGGSAFGAAGYRGAQPTPPMPARPVSFHERSGVGSRADYDTLSLRSLRLGAGGLDDRYSVLSEQLEPAATSTYRAFAYERQASSSSSRAGGLDWPEAPEASPSRTIRAPAMRTLQRFQSGHRSRGVGGAAPGAVLEPVARAPSVRSLSLSLADSGHLPDVRGFNSYGSHRTLQRLSSGFDDIDLPSAVKYLMASDPNLQVLGAAYIQHKCYSDAVAKKQARSLQAVPRLVKLFNHANQEVQRHATGAMRNLIYDNADNKLALVEENGIFELLRTLREQDDELRKNVTGATRPLLHLCVPLPITPLPSSPPAPPTCPPSAPLLHLPLRHLRPLLHLPPCLSPHCLTPSTCPPSAPLIHLPSPPPAPSACPLLLLRGPPEGGKRMQRPHCRRTPPGEGLRPPGQDSHPPSPQWAGVLSRLALEQERILNPLLDRVRTADHHQLRSLTGLIRNLSRNARNKDEMSTKVVSHLIEKLPGSVGEKSPPAEVLVNIIAVLNNLVVASPIAARDLLYFDGLRKLIFIKKKRDSPDSEKSSRAASSLLANLWQYNKLHRDFRAKGYRKDDFLGP
uniref:Plakophilin 3 n=1 Tax=Nomascus leucogenys TaxID=61853 RepID=G1R9W3_NOMLE